MGGGGQICLNTSTPLTFSPVLSASRAASSWQERLQRRVTQAAPHLKGVSPPLRTQGLPAPRRTFMVADLSSGGQTAHEEPATLLYAGEGVAAYVSDVDAPSEAQLEDARKVARAFAERIKPFADQLWGPSSDVDRDGRVTLLMTGTRNRSGLAVGFFNPFDSRRP